MWLFVFAVCNKMTKYRAISPFLCMDMTYITCLLKEGFGFKDSTVLQVSKSVESGSQRYKNMKSYMTKPSYSHTNKMLQDTKNTRLVFFKSMTVSVGVGFFVVLMILSLCLTASQESEQRGDKLGPGGNLWLLQKPQHPLRTARCHCSLHWEGQSVTVGLPVLCPSSISPSPQRHTWSHHASSSTTLHLFSSTSAPGEHSENCWKKEITIFL